jgi:hypothetical protein
VRAEQAGIGMGDPDCREVVDVGEQQRVYAGDSRGLSAEALRATSPTVDGEDLRFTDKAILEIRRQTDRRTSQLISSERTNTSIVSAWPRRRRPSRN